MCANINMFEKEEAENIKKQLLEQVENWNLDLDKKEKLKNYILSLDEAGLEDFLIKNNLIKEGEAEEEVTQNQCVFCMIAQGKVPSYIIAENNENLAILEIKPLSKGHVMIVPKQHLSIEELNPSTFELLSKVVKKLKSKLNPKEISLSSSFMFGHAVINILPLQGDETGERKPASKQELEDLQRLLFIGKDEKKEVKEEVAKSEEKTIYKLPRRIP